MNWRSCSTRRLLELASAITASLGDQRCERPLTLRHESLARAFAGALTWLGARETQLLGELWIPLLKSPSETDPTEYGSG